MRTFVGIAIEDRIRQRLGAFVEEMRRLAPEARWVRPESLHITLKFIGELKPDKVAQARQLLSEIRGEPAEISFRGIGFFPTVRAARVFWVGVEAGPGLATLASDIENSLVELGIEKEKREFSPHLTLARSGSGAPRRLPTDRSSRVFAGLQARLPEPPDPEFGTMTARQFHLYESKLLRGGAVYTTIATFPLR